MEPTTIKTKTTKPLSEYSGENLSGYIDVGGVWHRINFSIANGHPRIWRPGHGQRWRGVSSRAAVTITEERPMAVEDLGPGDCFRVANQRDDIEFMVWLGDYECVRVWDDGKVNTLQQPEIAKLEVTLVTPSFEAEPVRESAEPISLSRMKAQERFCLGGMEAVLGIPYEECADKHRGYVIFCDPKTHENDTHLPGELMVQPIITPSYDSWDDVGVGEVFVPTGPLATNRCGICIGDNLSIMSGVSRPKELVPFGGHANSFRDFAPARLTDVSWERIPEVER